MIRFEACVWPFLLGDRDFIDIAATGSEKLIVFGVPTLMHVKKKLGKKAE